MALYNGYCCYWSNPHFRLSCDTSIENWDKVDNMETNFSAVMANINNIGPGFDKCGAAQNYAFFHPLSKLVLIFDMLVGRLELYPMLILFNPKIWQETLTQGNHKLKKRLHK